MAPRLPDSIAPSMNARHRIAVWEPVKWTRPSGRASAFSKLANWPALKVAHVP